MILVESIDHFTNFLRISKDRILSNKTSFTFSHDRILYKISQRSYTLHDRDHDRLSLNSERNLQSN